MQTSENARLSFLAAQLVCATKRGLLTILDSPVSDDEDGASAIISFGFFQQSSYILLHNDSLRS